MYHVSHFIVLRSRRCFSSEPDLPHETLEPHAPKCPSVTLPPRLIHSCPDFAKLLHKSSTPGDSMHHDVSNSARTKCLQTSSSLCRAPSSALRYGTLLMGHRATNKAHAQSKPTLLLEKHGMWSRSPTTPATTPCGCIHTSKFPVLPSKHASNERITAPRGGGVS